MKHLDSVPKPAVKETARAARNGDILGYARVQTAKQLGIGRAKVYRITKGPG